MSHIHVAIFKWKASASRSEIEAALKLVKQVADRVEGLQAIYCGGPNTNGWGQGFTDCVVVIADSAEALQRYRDDSVHEEAAKLIEAMEADGIGIDFEDID